MGNATSDATIEGMYRDLIASGHLGFRDPAFWAYWARVQRRRSRAGAQDPSLEIVSSFGTEDRSLEFVHRDLHAEDGGWGTIRPGQARMHRYGIVTFNIIGEVLLRESANHSAANIWQFAKGTPEEGEHTLETAVREMVEETGHRPSVVGFIPGSFSSGGGTINHYYLGEDHRGLVEPMQLANNGETSDLRWVEVSVAFQMLGQSPNRQGGIREQTTLRAACAAYNMLGSAGRGPRIELPEDGELAKLNGAT